MARSFLTPRQTAMLSFQPPDVQRRMIEAMTPHEALMFDADFENWALDGQREPSGAGWRTWLMRAGRGFGKTRAGAEWISRLATMRGRAVRIALVGASLDDARRVVAVAYGVRDVPGDYAMRGAHRARLQAGLAARGFRPKPKPEPGDVIMFDIEGRQLHLGIWTGSSLIHADAEQRRVVERPGEAAWPAFEVWGLTAPLSLAALAPLHHASHGPPPLQKQGRI